MPDVITASIRVRMSQRDAHYGGNLVPGARVLEMFGDLITEITIRADGDEGLLTTYDKVEFTEPVYAGDYIEATARMVKKTRLRRIVEFEARKVISARYDLGKTSARVLDEPVLVCRAVGVSVIPMKVAQAAAGSPVLTR
jgi:3-aminobutyryl-CoA ammonia-lyase